MSIIETNERELEVLKTYRVLYEAQHPYPELGGERSWRDGGIIFIGKMVTTVAAILLAGFRTAEQFFLAASNQGNVSLGWVEAILAVLAIEGLILFLAADRAKQRGKIHSWASGLGILLAVGISLLAGLGQSIRLIDGLDTEIFGWFTTALAIGLAFASIVAYIGGEIVGQELARIDIANKQRWDEYKQAVDEWEKSMQASYSRSQERKLVRAGLGGKLPEITGKLSPYSDWRDVPDEEKIEIAFMSSKKISKKYSVTDRTARNWRTNALEFAEKHSKEYVYNEDN